MTIRLPIAAQIVLAQVERVSSEIDFDVRVADEIFGCTTIQTELTNLADLVVALRVNRTAV